MPNLTKLMLDELILLFVGNNTQENNPSNDYLLSQRIKAVQLGKFRSVFQEAKKK